MPDEAAAGATVHCFTEVTSDATIHFQVVDVGRQLFIWLGVGGAKLKNLYFGISSATAPEPSVATLLPDGAKGEAQSLTQRLTMRLKRPVMCSCNLPANSPMLQAVAERRLLRELESMGLCPPSAALVRRSESAVSAAPPSVDLSEALRPLSMTEDVV